MNDDILHTMWLIIGCLTLYSISDRIAAAREKPKQLELTWRVIHRTCTVNELRSTIDKIKQDVLGIFYEYPIPETVSIVNAQDIIRSRVGRIVVLSTKDLNLCFNEFTNSDWNCVQDRSTFALVTDLKAYDGPSEVSVDIELLL